MRVGVLALQGAFERHQSLLQRAGYDSCLLKQPKDFKDIEALVLPGGESTTQLKLIDSFNLMPSLQECFDKRLPIFATCAGVVLVADKVISPEQESFGWAPITVARNAYGSQMHSFTRQVDFNGQSRRLIFIRAPKVVAAADSVETLLAVDAAPVLLRMDNITLATFHPELDDDQSFYQMAFGASKRRMKSTTPALNLLRDRQPGGCSN